MAEEKEVNKEQQNPESEQQEQRNDKQDAAEAKANADEPAKELSPEEKYAELHDKFIRIHAEFDNYRRRTNKEKLDIIATANAAVLKDLLGVLDDFDRAAKNNEQANDIDSVKEGFKLIHHKLKHILESKGLKEMKADGEVFDSELHEAIANIPAPDKKAVGKVIEAVEKGYYLHDHVIRYAKVVVGQ